MATVLGKRKSRASAAPKAAAPAANKPAVSEEEAREIFRRHFEAQFAPLAESTTESKETHGKKSKSKGGEKKQKRADDDVEDMRSEDEDEDEDDGEDDSDDEDQDDWGGLSGSDDDEEAEQDTAGPNQIEVVDYSQSNTPTNPLAQALARREAKTYLSSKVPLSSVGGAEVTKQTKSNKTKTPTDEDSADLVKNDLALQRLLSESHLFNPTKRSGSLIGSAVTTEHTGRNRHLATDMRVAALAENKNKPSMSIFKQDKMPMSHRKGIEGARRDRDAKRRREAKENGIILEKATATGGAGKKSGPHRSARGERAVDAPAVGKLRNGMLRLSKRDVAEINGPVRRGNDKKKRRR